MNSGSGFYAGEAEIADRRFLGKGVLEPFPKRRINYKQERGRIMLFSEFKCKEVINLRNCKQLGRVGDLEFDECSGCIHKIYVPRGSKWENFFKCQEDYCIPFRDIKQIGPDIILVDICED